jgi:phenylalanyl-tRNA synthetase beta chain
LQKLGFVAKSDDGFTVPSWRYGDVKEAVDLAEEVIRLSGFNNIKPEPLPAKTKHDQGSFDMSLRAKLCDMGLTETYSYSFLSAKEIEAAGTKQQILIEVANPLSENHRYMRPSLIPKLVQTASANPWFNDFTVFEIGHVFHAPEDETNYLGIVSTNVKGQIADIFTDGQIEKIAVDSALGRLFKLRRPVFVAEAPVSDIKLETQSSHPITSQALFKNISKYPPVIEDVAFIVDRDVDALTIARDIMAFNTDGILLAEPFDEFVSDKLGADKKSIALHVIYQDTKETLTSDRASQLHRRTVEFLKQKYNAKLRGE